MPDINQHSVDVPAIRNRIIDLLESGSHEDFLSFFNSYHEADIAEAIQELPTADKIDFIKKVTPENAAEIIEEMSLPQQTQLISSLKITLGTKVIEEMEPDNRVDLIEELQASDLPRAKKIIRALPKEEKTELKTLLSYPEDSAGAIMTTSFLYIPENLTVKQAIEAIKVLENKDAPSYFIYIVNTYNQLVGHITFRHLVLTAPDVTIKSIRDDAPIFTFVDTDQEDVARSFRKYGIVEMPVLDQHNQLLGVITVDDVVDVVMEEATEDIYKLSGTSESDESRLLTSTIFRSTLSRSPWLMITIFGGILASLLISYYANFFSPKLFSLALSLSFIPMLMGLGGNVGNQSAAIIVRGLATGTIKPSSAIQTIAKEVLIGLLMGTLLAVSVFLFNLVISNHTLIFSSIVSLALFFNILFATFIGSALPLLFVKLRIDPAIASAPFISTALDIAGQIIYFSLTLKILSFIS